MPGSMGVNLRVTGNCRQGGRKYMEDRFAVAYQCEDERDLEYAFFGIYDGHGGAEAASFARQHLMDSIVNQKGFWSSDDDEILKAIKDGYIATHHAMWKEQPNWPKTNSGLPSTAGTTASVAFIRQGKIYIGHVGDSGIVLGFESPGSVDWQAKSLTIDHKPESPNELKRIESCGGKVVSKSGVPRVVWNRPKIGHQGPVTRSTPIDEIPFLAVARSLGDLWSYNSQLGEFVVSPEPDCMVISIDPSIHRCLIFGTDGLFNMLSPSMAVHIVQQTEIHNEREVMSDNLHKAWLNPSKLLVEKALERWQATKLRADNTSAITLMLDPPGPSRVQVLRNRKKSLLNNGGIKIITRCDKDSAEAVSKQTVPYTQSVVTTNGPISGKIGLIDTIRESIPTPSCSSSVSSSDVSDNYPLRERNVLPNVGEALVIDTHHLQNASLNSDDNSIQINEISSTNIDDSLVDENNTNEIMVNQPEQNEDVKCQFKKRKNPVTDHCYHQQRKSLRLNQIDGVRSPAPCTLAEEKLKKLAREAEQSNQAVKTEAKNNTGARPKSKFNLSEKLLRCKKLHFKRKQMLNAQLKKKKFELVLEGGIVKNGRRLRHQAENGQVGPNNVTVTRSKLKGKLEVKWQKKEIQKSIKAKKDSVLENSNTAHFQRDISSHKNKFEENPSAVCHLVPSRQQMNLRKRNLQVLNDNREVKNTRSVPSSNRQTLSTNEKAAKENIKTKVKANSVSSSLQNDIQQRTRSKSKLVSQKTR